MKAQFTLLLLALLAILLLLPALSTTTYAFILEISATWTLIAVGLWALAKSRGIRLAAFFLAAFAVGMDVAATTLGEYSLMPFGRIAMASFIGLLSYVIIDHVLTHEDVTFDLILGAVCSYILIGVLFAEIYATLEILDPGAFTAGGRPLAAAGSFDQVRGHVIELIYYSIVTLTTVGYGDIMPVNGVARAVSSVQAIIGQIYPAVLIAHLVSIRASQGPVQYRTRKTAS